jgi:hypothetical protein
MRFWAPVRCFFDAGQTQLRVEYKEVKYMTAMAVQGAGGKRFGCLPIVQQATQRTV